MQDLQAYIDAASRRRFEWGALDCCTFAFDWVKARTGIDVMDPYRGRYHNRISAVRLFAGFGGLDAAVRSEMERCGFQPTRAPEAGDVGVVRVPVQVRGGMPVMGPVAALCIGKFWAVVGNEGLCGGEFETLAAWTVR